MAIAKAGGIGKKRPGFDIKNQIFQENNTIRSSIVRYLTTFDFIGYERPWHAL